jgi:hypothetical protein
VYVWPLANTKYNIKLNFNNPCRHVTYWLASIRWFILINLNKNDFVKNQPTMCLLHKE